ncbi:ArsR/SmtB family transcription factor [Nocardiopsis salina]|uniref:ArsR/SmtB family transcription factor n=1 Tax=Nocardiopsis salina TaxID=245836 RepID=UPI0003484BFE|nr:metalloregulator ArsR/SmtB family transcription factor [Nocardiopsis salina]
MGTPRTVIEPDRVESALRGLGDGAAVRDWAQRYAVVADPTRLTLLVCIHYAGPICVSDLALAADMGETTVSQALRHLRAHDLVDATREGKLVRYRLTDETVHELIHLVRPHSEETGP